MKVAVVYNKDSRSVINLFGRQNQELIGLKTIRRIVNALKSAGHQATAFEGDKELVNRLEEFMPRVLKGERPGMVFNVSYGIQGQARYTHVPGILEMVGIPYVGSGPLAHSLALDKVVSKVIFKQHGVPTADFVVLDAPGFQKPDLPYPLIVKPKNEAVSFGIQVVNNEAELRAAAQVIFDRFEQPVLAEQYIEGREINVGLLGNNPPEALPPAEIIFSKDGPKIYTYEDKTRKSGREVHVKCPADLPPAVTAEAQDIAKKAFKALGCHDCARVDMRMDRDGKFYVLEINSLPSLGEHGSYTHAAETVGLDYPGLVNRLVEVASARYFGTPAPPQINTNRPERSQLIFSRLTERRDLVERRLKEWVALSSRTSDPVGLREARRRVATLAEQLGLKSVKAFTNDHSVWTWETAKGLKGGTLLVLHLDVPLEQGAPSQGFRREAEWLYGEGVGASRAPLVMTEFALQALRENRILRHRNVGLLCYTDEGRDARYSAETIRQATAQARNVLVLRPGTLGDLHILQRRGQRKYRLVVEGTPRRLGQHSRCPETLVWLGEKLKPLTQLSSRQNRLAVSLTGLHTTAFPMLLPHRVSAILLVSYPDAAMADATENKIRALLDTKDPHCELEMISDRPPMKDRRRNQRLSKRLGEVAVKWEIPYKAESSVWPSVAGLVAGDTGVVCGLGPVARDLYTPQEAVQRISLIQRTLLLAQFLAEGTNRQLKDNG